MIERKSDVIRINLIRWMEATKDSPMLKRGKDLREIKREPG